MTPAHDQAVADGFPSTVFDGSLLNYDGSNRASKRCKVRLVVEDLPNDEDEDDDEVN